MTRRPVTDGDRWVTDHEVDRSPVFISDDEGLSAQVTEVTDKPGILYMRAPASARARTRETYRQASVTSVTCQAKCLDLQGIAGDRCTRRSVTRSVTCPGHADSPPTTSPRSRARFATRGAPLGVTGGRYKRELAGIGSTLILARPLRKALEVASPGFARVDCWKAVGGSGFRGWACGRESRFARYRRPRASSRPAIGSLRRGKPARSR